MRRRLVWIQGGAPMGSRFVALFRRTSDGRFFVHPPLDTTDPNVGWSVSSLIDAGTNFGNAISFVAENNQGQGWIGWKTNSFEYFSSSGNGFFTIPQIASAIGIPADEVDVREVTLCNRGNWGQIYINRAGTADPFRVWQVTYNNTGVLSWNTADGLISGASYYALPSVSLPWPERPNGTLGVSFQITSNANNSIGLFALGSTVYIAIDGVGYSPLIAGVGAPSDLLTWFTNNLTWMYGDILYSRPVGFGVRTGAIYRLTGNTMNLVEPRSMRLPSGISGYFLERYFVTPA
jgi:hypothetical protein